MCTGESQGHAGTAGARAKHVMSTTNVDTDTFKNRIRISLKELRVQHRDLDVAIAELIKNPHADQLRVSRLKKQKLRLKDEIAVWERRLVPDIIA